MNYIILLTSLRSQTITKRFENSTFCRKNIYISSNSSSSIGTTAHCGLWPVEQCPSIFSYQPPTLSIFSLPALEDLFLLPLFFELFDQKSFCNQLTIVDSLMFLPFVC